MDYRVLSETVIGSYISQKKVLAKLVCVDLVRREGKEKRG